MTLGTQSAKNLRIVVNWTLLVTFCIISFLIYDINLYEQIAPSIIIQHIGLLIDILIKVKR